MTFTEQFQDWQTRRKLFEDGRVADQRRAICTQCEFRRPGFFCGKCHCPLALKILVMEQKCPVGKW